MHPVLSIQAAPADATMRSIRSDKWIQSDVYKDPIPLPAARPPPVPPRQPPRDVSKVQSRPTKPKESTSKITEIVCEECSTSGINGYNQPTWKHQSQTWANTYKSTRDVAIQAIPEMRNVETQTDFEMTFPWCGSTSRRPYKGQWWGWCDTLENRDKSLEELLSVSSESPTVSSMSIETRSLNGWSCWQCNQQGHRFLNCPSEQLEKFCYRCGERGVTVRQCPKCRLRGERKGFKDLKI